MTVDIREIEKSKTRITKAVDRREEVVEAVLRDEEIEVRRVPIGRVVAEAPSSRQDGDTMVIPVLREEAVLEKRLVLAEEIHVTRRSTARPFRQTVELRSERAVVEQTPSTPKPPKT